MQENCEKKANFGGRKYENNEENANFIGKFVKKDQKWGKKAHMNVRAETV